MFSNQLSACVVTQTPRTRAGYSLFSNSALLKFSVERKHFDIVNGDVDDDDDDDEYKIITIPTG